MTARERVRRAAEGLRVLASLAPGERRLFARAYALLVLEVLRRRTRRPGSRWLPDSESLAPVATGPAPDPRRLELFALAERTLVVTPTCLPRALALGRYLADNGCRTQLVLGVRRGPSGIEGHAWRQWGSRVLQGGEHASRFRRFERFPPGGASGGRRDE